MKKSVAAYVLVLDAGTTGVKAFLFDQAESIVAKASCALTKSFPKAGWVEQDPLEIITAARGVLQEVVLTSNVPPSQIQAFGIATQRETVVMWDKQTSRALYPAIVWQDVRGQAWCESRPADQQELVRQKTGLSIDPYFSASKIVWLLQNVPEVQTLLSSHQLAVGTIDTWLLWNLAQGSPYLTDYTNACRTLLFNIRTLDWDPEVLRLFDIPAEILPKVQPSISTFGLLRKDIVGQEIPIMAVAGDQQASLYAAGTEKGTTKITYGTGTFVMQVLGGTFNLHKPFFTTLAVNSSAQPWYALEAKATSGVENADEILQDPSLLSSHLEYLVESANQYVQQLPHKPEEIMIDGGWIRDGKIRPLQTAISQSQVREQDIYDGTALGVYRMMRESKNGP